MGENTYTCIHCGEKLYVDEVHNCEAGMCDLCKSLRELCPEAVGDDGCLVGEGSCPVACTNACMGGRNTIDDCDAELV